MPDQVAFDPLNRTVFAGSVGSVLSVITLNPATGGPLVTSVASQVGARTIAVNETTGRAFNVTEGVGPAGPSGLPTPYPGTVTLLTYAP